MKNPKSSRKRYRIYYTNNSVKAKKSKGSKKGEKAADPRDRKAEIITLIIIILIALLGIFRACQVANESTNHKHQEKQIDNK